MTESRNADAAGTWSVPECPFAIEYSLRVLDDIRLAVMDAFFSLPRGGAEIGGVLLGRFENARLTIANYVALDCEHAFGPSFTLSPRDEQKLRALLESAAGNGSVPVGWYHSHTRSGIFLSDADLEVHRRFFPEPWQVALVMKPHTFQPMRCGFFFREPGGSIQAASSIQEFTLDALSVRPVPSGDLPFVAGPPHVEVNSARRTIDIAAAAPETSPAGPRGAGPEVVEPPPAAPRSGGPPVEPAAAGPRDTGPEVVQPPPPALRSPRRHVMEAAVAPRGAGPRVVESPAVASVTGEPLPEPPPPEVLAASQRPEANPETRSELALTVPSLEPPQLLRDEPRSWVWLKVVLAIAVGAGLGAAGFQTRQLWLPRVSGMFASPGLPQAPSFAPIGLSAIDIGGQLQIRWDRYSPAVRQATGGHLNITDSEGTPRDIKVDATQLQAGSFTYERQGESVNVVLTLDEPNGRQTHEASTFVGKLPVKQQAPDATASEIEKQRDEFARETVRLRQETGALQQQVNGLHLQLTLETEKNRKLEQELHSVREQLLDQIRRRMGNQAGK